MAKRNAKGQFKKGSTGNPGGMPKGYAEVRKYARSHTLEAIDFYLECMRNEKAPWAVRKQCADAICDRGWGKPGVAEGERPEGEQVPIYVLRDEPKNGKRVDPEAA